MVQLKYEMPCLVQDEHGRGLQGGVGNSVLGAKWRFLDHDQLGIAMSISPQVEFNTAHSSQRRGLVSENKALLLPVEVGRNFGEFAVAAEAGYVLIERETDAWLYGLVIGYSGIEKMDLLAEARGVAEHDFDAPEVILQLGTRHHLTKNFSFLLAAGRGIISAGKEEVKWLGYAGMQFRF